MNYFGDNDYELRYNKAAVNSAIADAEKKISDICSNISNLSAFINDLENNAHDKVGTCVDQDYKDYESVLGYDALTGLMSMVSADLDNLKGEMSRYERVVNQNIERRRQEEEEQKKKQGNY